MRTKCIDVYKFPELSDKAKAKAIQKHCYINVDSDWWDSTYEDAANVGITITGFDIGRGQDCTGSFKGNALDTATAIIKDHGEACETRKTAEQYIQSGAALMAAFKKDETGMISDEDEDKLEDLNKEFLKSILGDYLKILREDYEFLTQEEQIRETIEANEMEFTIDGKDA